MVFLLSNQALCQTDYEKAIQAIDKNQMQEAEQYLKSAMKSGNQIFEASVLYSFLDDDMPKDREGLQSTLLKEIVKLNDPNPYYFSLWFSEYMFNGYDVKNTQSIKFIEQIMEDKKTNTSILSALYYVLRIHNIDINKPFEAQKMMPKMGAVMEWSVVGPFENLQGSGFNKAYPPIEKASKTEVFTSSRYQPIQWRVPKIPIKESWISLTNFFYEKTGILYAQSFVESDKNQDVFLGLGYAGNCKVFVNQEEVYASEKEVLTELDAFVFPVKLQKGSNRILVQIGYFDKEQPNFMLRVLDQNMAPISLPASPFADNYIKTSIKSPHPVKEHFAIKYFREKYDANPYDLLNLLLYVRALKRLGYEQKSLEILQKYLTKQPNNPLVEVLYLSSLSKKDDRADLLKEIEIAKTRFPNSFICLLTQFREYLKNEDYPKAQETLNKMENLNYSKLMMYNYWVDLYSEMKDMKKMIEIVEASYKDYPENKSIFFRYFLLQLKGLKNTQEALKLANKFSAKHYHARLQNELKDYYYDAGDIDKAIEIQKGEIATEPSTDYSYYSLASLYYIAKDYKNAETYVDSSIQICDGNWKYWDLKGMIYEMNNKDEKAKEFFKIALRLNPVNYNIRKKLYKNDPSKDVTNLIKFEKMEDYLKMETPNEVKDKFPIHYLFDETYKIVYPEGASEEYCHFAIRILNKDGIDRCKEINVGEDTYAKYFKIENAQVYKKSGTKFKADVSGNDVVFPNLEVGDIVYVKYKIEYYFQGKFARDFFESFSCQTLYPTTLMRHSFIVAKNINFNIKEKNGKQEYSKEDLGEFNAWHWVQKNNPGFVREPFMPASKDFLPTTEISTLKSWNDIAQWYSDVSLLQSEPGERVKAVVQDLMSKNPKANNKEKAKIIYEYILKNIRYSSIPFRQSALVPQKAELVIESKLGDCKDLSTLFVSMCKVANIDANLVLVATNDDGFYQMDLPSINFNHCIVRLNVEQKPIYLELTNPFLAFGASQFNLEGAQFLNIPRKVEPSYQAKIENFDFSNAIQSRVHRSSKITVKENNLNVNVKSTKFGYSASSSRRVFSELDEEKTRKKNERTSFLWCCEYSRFE